MLFEKTTPICGSVYFVLGYLSYRKLELKSRSKSPHKLQLFLVLACPDILFHREAQNPNVT